jgi:hypothetical protein
MAALDLLMNVDYKHVFLCTCPLLRALFYLVLMFDLTMCTITAGPKIRFWNSTFLSFAAPIPFSCLSVCHFPVNPPPRVPTHCLFWKNLGNVLFSNTFSASTVMTNNDDLNIAYHSLLEQAWCWSILSVY